ncbi:unnamed protein product [Rotaria sp. Silwood1]|nr:unnamed protein product [Rotaria sp. Silwood1]
MHMLKTSIQNYLTANVKQDDRVFCLNNECNGLIQFKCNYQACLICGRHVDPKDQVIDDEFHVGRTCVQQIEEQQCREFLPQFFEGTKKFIRKH